MEIKKISDFEQVNEVNDDSFIPVVQDSNNKKIPYFKFLEGLKNVISGLVRVVNSLTSTSPTDALSAAMGKELQDTKVDIVEGMGLSKNDFTDDYLNKIEGIEEGAQVNPNFKTINDQRIDDGPGNINISSFGDVADDLVTWDSTKALSAKQGVILARAANSTDLGRVKPDGVTTFVDANGVLSTSPVEIPTYNSWIFKESETQPATPDITLNATLADPDPLNWDVSSTPQFAGWVDAPNYQDGQMWWMCVGTVNGSTRRVSKWNTPMPVIGEEGQGGGYEDFKFGIGTADNYPTPFHTNPNNGNAPNYHPEVWKDIVNGDELVAGQYIWMTHAYYDNDQFGTWSVPVRVNGENGADGKGYEYIYLRTTTNQVPETPTAPVDDPTLDQNYPAPWTDNPSGISEENPYEWVSQRQKIDGSWTVYSTPKLWASFGQKGNPGVSVLFENKGDWSATEQYYSNDKIRQIVKYNNLYYATNYNIGDIPIGTVPTDTSYWEYFTDQFEMVATTFFFAEGANIAGWIFKIDDNGDKLLMSQDQTEGRPNTILNGTTGQILSNLAQNWQMALDPKDNAFYLKDGNTDRKTINIGQFNTGGVQPYAVVTLRSLEDVNGYAQITSEGFVTSNSYYSSISGGGGGQIILRITDAANSKPSLIISDSLSRISNPQNNYSTSFRVVADRVLTVIAENLPTTDPHVAGQIYRDGTGSVGTPSALMISNG